MNVSLDVPRALTSVLAGVLSPDIAQTGIGLDEPVIKYGERLDLPQIAFASLVEPDVHVEVARCVIYGYNLTTEGLYSEDRAQTFRVGTKYDEPAGTETFVRTSIPRWRTMFEEQADLTPWLGACHHTVIIADVLEPDILEQGSVPPIIVFP